MLLAPLLSFAVSASLVPPPRVPDSALYLVAVSPQDARRYARASIQLAATAGLPASAVGSAELARAIALMGPGTREAILKSNGLTLAAFERIRAQVRHSRPLGRVVSEELRLATHADAA
jgi:hypothetical protein